MPSVKEIYKKIDDVRLEADTVNVNVDGLEALASTQQADIALIKADVDDIRADLANGVTINQPVAITDNGGSLTVDGPLTDSELRASAVTANTNLRDGSGNAITSTTSGASRRLDVMLSSGGTTGSAAPTNANLVGGTDGTNLRAFSTDTAGKLQAIVNNSDLSSLISYDFTGVISTNTVLIPSTDVGTYAEASIQAVAMGTGLVVRFQYSNDNSTWVTAPIQILTDTTSTPVSQFSSASIYKLPLFGAKYMRAIASTGASGGTTTLRVYLNQRATTAISQAVNIANSGTNLNVAPVVSTGGGAATHHKAISASGTNATSVKATSGNIAIINLANTSSSFKYLKLFSLATAPTVGTSDPTLNIAIPPNSTISVDCGFAGMRLSSGIAYAITGGQAALDTTSVAAGDVMVNISYA